MLCAEATQHEQERALCGGRLPAWSIVAIVMITWVVQLVVIVWNHNASVLCEDEIAFLGNTRLLMERGLTPAYLENMTGQAFGPLLNVVHLVAFPLTGLSAPAVRVVHWALMALFFGALFWMFRAARQGMAWPLVLSFGAIPMIWYQSGGVWSHLPTMVVAVISLHCLSIALAVVTSSVPRAVVIAVLAGLIYGWTILGRSTFLAPLACLPLFLVGQPNRRLTAVILGIFAVVALCICVPVFLIWKGLVPPQQAFVGRGVNAWHLTLSFAYGFFLVLFVSPAWLQVDRRSLMGMGAISIVTFLINAIWLNVAFRPMGPLASRVLPAMLLRVYELTFPALLVGLAAGMVIAFARFTLRYRMDGRMLFLGAAAFVMLMTSLKLTHVYSSAYTLQCLPFLVLPLAMASRGITWFAVARTLLGAALGLVAYTSWLSSLPPMR